MTELLEIAIKKVRSLPEAEQNRIARVMLFLIEFQELSDVIDLNHLAYVLEDIAKIESGLGKV
jgi:hypothetical protein